MLNLKNLILNYSHLETLIEYLSSEGLTSVKKPGLGKIASNFSNNSGRNWDLEAKLKDPGPK